MKISKVTKQDFIEKVRNKLKVPNVDITVLDVIIETSETYNIDVETAARIVKSSPELMELLNNQAGKESLLKKV